MLCVLLLLIRWIAIYPLDIVIRPFYNWAQVFAFFYSAHSFSPVLCRGKSAAVMVNLTYVVLLVGWQGMLRKFSFAVTCFYSLEKLNIH